VRWWLTPVILAVRKNATHKESSREKSHVQEPGLMAGSNCQAGREFMAVIEEGA
jgi:hypothetical protein